MNMNPSRWERTINAICGVAFVAFLIPFFAYVAVCYVIHRVSLRIPGGLRTMGMDAPRLSPAQPTPPGFGAFGR
jgi:hypothetical protein